MGQSSYSDKVMGTVHPATL